MWYEERERFDDEWSITWYFDDKEPPFRYHIEFHDMSTGFAFDTKEEAIEFLQQRTESLDERERRLEDRIYCLADYIRQHQLSAAESAALVNDLINPPLKEEKERLKTWREMFKAS